jgi:hypothetical protein
MRLFFTLQACCCDACIILIWNFELCISGPAIPALWPSSGCAPLLPRSPLPNSGRREKLRHPRHPAEMKHLGMLGRNGYLRGLIVMQCLFTGY